MSENLPNRTLPVSKAAEQLGVHPETLRRWEKDGAIRAVRTNGGQRRYDQRDLETMRTGESGGQAPLLPSISPQIPVRTMEQFRPRPSYRFLILFAVVMGLLIAVLGWSQLSPLSRERLKRAFSPSVQVPIADVNDVMGYKLSESFEILGLKFKFPVDLPGLVTQTFTVLGDSVLNGARFLGTVLFGQGNDYFIPPTGDASFNSVTSNTGEVPPLRATNLTVTGPSTGTGGGGGGGPAEGGDADTLGGQVGSYYLDLDNETGTCTDCLTGVEIDESTLTISLSDADLLDGQTGSYYLDRANHTGTQTAATLSDFNEVSQESVGGILTDTTSVNFTYDDLGNLITADVLAGGVDHGSLGGLGDDDHPQYLLAAGTRALTGNWDAGSFEIRAETFESDVATGTAPLIVASTTLVTNLNADLLDGQTGSYYLDLDNETGTCTDCLSTTEIDESTFTGLGSANISDIYLFNSGDTATGDYNFDVNTFVIDSAIDSVGVGDATPDGKLDVEPTGAVTVSNYGINLSNLVTNATTDGINKYGAYITSTGGFGGGGGAATSNWGLYVDTISGADLNYGAYFANNVGIGDSSPAALLTVGANDLFQIASTGDLTTANAGSWTFSNDTNFVLSGGTNGLSFDTSTLSIDALNHRVGIGTTSIPTGFVLDIDGSVRLRNAAATRYRSDWSVGATGLNINAFDDTGGVYIPFRLDGLSFAMRADASDAKSMTLSNSGDVGIGDAGPDGALDIERSGAAHTDLQIDNTNAGDFDPRIQFDLGGTDIFTIGVDDSDFDKFKIGTTALETNTRLTIDSTGSVGIGTASPVQLLDIEGSRAAYITSIQNTDAAAGQGLYINSAWTGGGSALEVQSNSTPRFRVNGAGTVYSFGTTYIGGTAASANAIVEMGQNGATGNRYAYIDMVGDDTYTDYGLRIIRNNTGANTNSEISHRGTGSLVLSTSDAGSDIVLTPADKIGLGTTTPDSRVQISGGALCVASDTNCNTDNNTEGIVYSSSINMTVYDVAEDYPTKDETLGPGEMIALDPNNEIFVRRADGSTGEILLGVISTQPAVHLGGFNGTQFQGERQVAVGLSGRVPVRVTAEGGEIAVGDPLTS